MKIRNILLLSLCFLSYENQVFSGTDNLFEIFNEYTEEFIEYKKILKKDPKNLEALYGMVEYYSKLQQKTGDEEKYKEYEKLSKKYYDQIIKIKDQKISHFDLVELENNSEDLEKLEDCFFLYLRQNNKIKAQEYLKKIDDLFLRRLDTIQENYDKKTLEYQKKYEDIEKDIEERKEKKQISEENIQKSLEKINRIKEIKNKTYKKIFLEKLEKTYKRYIIFYNAANKWGISTPYALRRLADIYGDSRVKETYKKKWSDYLLEKATQIENEFLKQKNNQFIQKQNTEMNDFLKKEIELLKPQNSSDWYGLASKLIKKKKNKEAQYCLKQASSLEKPNQKIIQRLKELNLLKE
jgi:hypothetical protein